MSRFRPSSLSQAVLSPFFSTQRSRSPAKQCTSCMTTIACSAAETAAAGDGESATLRRQTHLASAPVCFSLSLSLSLSSAVCNDSLYPRKTRYRFLPWRLLAACPPPSAPRWCCAHRRPLRFLAQLALRYHLLSSCVAIRSHILPCSTHRPSASRRSPGGQPQTPCGVFLTAAASPSPQRRRTQAGGRW